ncbi:phage Gp37/Gp68 family protein [Streptosporangium lutulentum]|uniref:Protein gp37 n=1 Tax=Streptosporangium lutulentum TaxID=1461250 RepID=A0ABT9QU85_9ACTN|nr:phage Gp37/Gp68 family protein [Streptosporangium lutulentum]MDP9850312.1 protein gp37 [Streptosporangium lutulentum]
MNTTTIEWTDASWNPVRGCTKVSKGCDHCYAEAISTHWNGSGSFDTVRLMPDVLDAPRRWRTPRRVFVNSMGDVLHEDIPDAYIARVLAVIAATPQHSYQLLTKRHGRLRTLFNSQGALRLIDAADAAGDAATAQALYAASWPLPNLWLGVSVEDQHWANLRIPALLAADATVRFLSVEPLLGPVDLARWLGLEWMESFEGWGAELFTSLAGRVGIDGGLHWVIAGGESGPRARTPHPDWFRTLRDQCDAAKVPFFFKQWGQWSPDLDGRGRLVQVLPTGQILDQPRPENFGEGLATMRRCASKRAAGRQLDGRLHDAFPHHHPGGLS